MRPLRVLLYLLYAHIISVYVNLYNKKVSHDSVTLLGD